MIVAEKLSKAEQNQSSYANKIGDVINPRDQMPKM
jgi:hypothetical protein